jgi:hypothetical protein
VPPGRRSRSGAIMWHKIEEYAPRNGRADLLIERIDGTVGA